MNVPKHHLIHDVATCWNSTTLIFQQLLEQRWVVYAVLHDERGSWSQYKHLHLKEEQWNLMDQMVTALEPLQIATTVLCETEIVCYSLIYPVKSWLLKTTMSQVRVIYHPQWKDSIKEAVTRYRKVIQCVRGCQWTKHAIYYHFRSLLSPANICRLFNKNNSLLHAYRKVGFTIFSI